MIKDATALLDYIREAANSILTSVQGISADTADVATIQADIATVKADIATVKADVAGILADTGGTLTAQLAAGEAHIGSVGGHAKTIQASFTRPNDTTTYAGGDVVSNSTSAPAVITFSGAARVSGGSGVLLGVGVVDSANQTLAGVFELWVFHTAPTPTNDNAAITFTDAELLNLVAIVPINTNYVGLATAGAGGNRVYDSDRVDKSFTCVGSANLFGVLVIRNAYVPVAQETFSINLYVLQD